MKFFARLRIGSRLILAFMVVALIGGLIGASGLVSMSRINDLNDQLYDRELLGLSSIKEANIALMAADRARTGFRTAATADERRRYRQAFDTYLATMRKELEAARGLFFSEEGRQAFADFDRAFADWQAQAEAFFAVAQRRELALEDAELRTVNVAARDAGSQVDQLMTRLVDIKERNGSDAAALSTQVYERMRLALVGMSLLGVLAGFLFGWLATRSITRPLSTAIAAAKRVADGDLTGRIESQARDETGDLMRALGAMNASLAAIVRDVREGSEGIAAASSQIAQGNTDLSQRTEEQASSLEQTAASMEELTSTVQHNATNAAQADKLVGEASEVAIRGGAVVKSVVQTMSSISDSSRRIAEITSVIDGIAFQTNILALNAAVEAARAGEQGRGFAVVAGEVRTLAQRSAVAAKEIKELIDESAARVDDGNRQVADAGRTMEEIVDAVKRVSALVGEISAASVQQASGIGQVNQAVSQMDEVTQQNAALVEEAAAAAASLLEQAERLARQVRQFRVDAGGAGPRAVPAPAPARPAAKPAAQVSPRPARGAAAAAPALAMAGPDGQAEWENF